MLRLIVAILIGGTLCCSCESAYRTHSVTHLRTVARNPDGQAGNLYAFSGRVIQSKEDRAGLAFQVVVGEYYGERSVDFGESVIFYFPATGTDIVKGDRVSVLGRVGTEISGRNAFGGRVSAVGMNAIAIVGPRRTYWLPEEEALFRAWESGTLFSSR